MRVNISRFSYLPSRGARGSELRVIFSLTLTLILVLLCVGSCTPAPDDESMSDAADELEMMSGETVSGETVSGEAVSGEAVSGEAVSGASAAIDQRSGDDNPPDGEMTDQSFVSSPHLLIGRGAQEFIAITDGEVSTLHRGCQGAQHLWVSLRLPIHRPNAYGLELTLLDQDDELLAPPFTLEEEEWLAYDVADQESQGSEIIGLTLVIFDPMMVVGEQALIKTRVFVGDEALESRVWVEVQWGADAC